MTSNDGDDMDAAAHDLDVTYWHGTHSLGLERGDVIVPRAQRTDLPPAPTSDAGIPAMFQGLYSVDRVYATTDREYARAWVARAGGALLRVQLLGELGPDTDTGDNGGVSADAARVLEVVERPVQMSVMQIRKAFARTDLSRYDDRGFLLPTQDVVGDLVAIGLTTETCRAFGRWINPHRVMFDPERGEFGYETNDFNLVYNQLLQALVEGHGITVHEAAEQVHRDPATPRYVEEETARRPIGWL